MRYCRACKTVVAEQAAVCPRCKSDKHLGTFGSGGTRAAGPAQPAATGGESEALQFTLGSLERRLEVGKKRSRWLAVGAVLVVLAGIGAWAAYYAATVRSYAEIDSGLSIARDALNPDWVLIGYRPRSPGRIGFGRADRDRETELVDRVAAAHTDEQKFQWRLSGVKTGDRLWVTHRTGWSLSRSELSVPASPPRPRLGDAVLVGQVVDATTNMPLADAEVRIVGTPLRTRTRADGRFRLTDAPESTVGIEVSAPNFSTEGLEKDLSVSKETHVRVVLSPGLKGGQIRAVLTWDDEPKDLDAHLSGPLPEGKSFHVYFGEKGDLKSKEFVNLDVDDRDGDGPETITVLGVLPGVYHYFVHDYSHASVENNEALARSGAEVKIYQGGQTYRFHADGQSTGNIWHVCEIEVTASGATVRKIDQYENKLIKTAITSVDVLFVMDTTGSMNSYINGLKAKCIDFADKVATGQRDCRLGLIGFGDVELGEPIYVFPPTRDARLFQTKVRDLPRTGGGDAPESPIDALERGMAMQFRDPCVKVFVLITDAPCKRAEEIPEIARQLKQRGIKTHVIAPAKLEDLYQRLCEDGGKFHSLNGATRFETLLLDIAEDVKRYTPQE